MRKLTPKENAAAIVFAHAFGGRSVLAVTSSSRSGILRRSTGHAAVVSLISGKTIMLHVENLKELNEEET